MISFYLELYAYNIDKKGISKKIYLKSPQEKAESWEKIIDLSSEQERIVSLAFNNIWRNDLIMNRYRLFDLSFRSDSVSLVFSDKKDWEFLPPDCIFQPFKRSGTLIEKLRQAEQAIFCKQPEYNPLFMIGLLFVEEELRSLKGYLRFDQEEFPNRLELIHRIISTVSETPKDKSDSQIEFICSKLEELGMHFSFIGIDWNGKIRYKLYFRFYEDYNSKETMNFLIYLIQQLGFSTQISQLFENHRNGIWGIALSTEDFSWIDGLQLYFKP